MAAYKQVTTVLREQLHSLIHEAAIDYDCCSSFAREWPFVGINDENMRAWLERNFKAAPPTLNDFISDICTDVAFLLITVLYPGLHQKENAASSQVVLDSLAWAVSAVPEYNFSRANVKKDLSHVVSEMGRLASQHEREALVPGVTDKMHHLLTASSLRSGYLLPILSMIATALVLLDGSQRVACYPTLRGFVSRLIDETEISRAELRDMVAYFATRVGTIEFVSRDSLLTAPDADTANVLQLAISESVEAEAKVERTRFPRADEPEVHEVVLSEAKQSKGEFDSILAELTDMIGLDSVKREVSSLANFIKVRRLREAEGMKQPPISMHLVFSGNPGTGKTTVARLVAQLYKELGVLAKGHLVEIDRSGLVGGYVGQTALKTKDVIERALDGVLFIDEAYTLANAFEQDFGKEAIDTLLKYMEDYRARLVVIVAGYSDRMPNFIASNPGLQSRFARSIEFLDYTAEEMLLIFERLAVAHNFELSSDSAIALRDHLRTVEGDDGFGNGRGVRNLFEAAVLRHANRIAPMEHPSARDLTILTRGDVLESQSHDA
jgi:ATPase family associated with various cellular activities (AAA)/AAA lid domain